MIVKVMKKIQNSNSSQNIETFSVLDHEIIKVEVFYDCSLIENAFGEIRNIVPYPVDVDQRKYLLLTL